MGLFGKFAYSDGRWRTGGPTAVPFLLLDVHDGDIATVDYRSADASGGRFHLGYEPRVYFDEPDAAAPVDAATEAEGISCRTSSGSTSRPSADGAPPERGSVTGTVERLLALAGLPLPDWPTDDDAPAG